MSLINSEDKKSDLVNILLFLGMLAGLLLFAFALYLDRKEAYTPLGMFLSAVGGGLITKAYKGSS